MTFAVDTSALVAVLRAEDDAPRIVQALGRSPRHLISAGSYLEACLVTTRKGSEAVRLKALLDTAAIDVVPVSLEDAEIAAGAFLRYGRGSGHKAQLNFGDCFAYALAKARNLPLLFKGDDFIHTDIEPALRPA